MNVKQKLSVLPKTHYWKASDYKEPPSIEILLYFCDNIQHRVLHSHLLVFLLPS